MADPQEPPSHDHSAGALAYLAEADAAIDVITDLHAQQLARQADTSDLADTADWRAVAGHWSPGADAAPLLALDGARAPDGDFQTQAWLDYLDPRTCAANASNDAEDAMTEDGDGLG